MVRVDTIPQQIKTLATHHHFTNEGTLPDIPEYLLGANSTEKVYVIARITEEYGISDSYITEMIHPGPYAEIISQMFKDAVHEAIMIEADEHSGEFHTRTYPDDLGSIDTYLSIQTNIDELVEGLSETAQFYYETEDVEKSVAINDSLDNHREYIFGDLTVVDQMYLIEETANQYEIKSVQESGQFPAMVNGRWEDVIQHGMLWSHLAAVIEAKVNFEQS